MRGGKPETGIVNRCPLLSAGRVCRTPSGAPETGKSISNILQEGLAVVAGRLGDCEGLVGVLS